MGLDLWKNTMKTEYQPEKETVKSFVLLCPFSEKKNTHGSALNTAWEQTVLGTRTAYSPLKSVLAAGFV